MIGNYRVLQQRSLELSTQVKNKYAIIPVSLNR